MKHSGRTSFIRQTVALTTELASFGIIPGFAANTPESGGPSGPKAGYSPQGGTMVSS